MARTLLTVVFLSAMALTGASAAATCNIDANTLQSADASHACGAIPSTITVTGASTLIATAPLNPLVKVFLNQTNLNWSGSSAQAITLCNQIVNDCGGTVGVAQQHGASVSTAGAFGGPGTISIVT